MKLLVMKREIGVFNMKMQNEMMNIIKLENLNFFLVSNL